MNSIFQRTTHLAITALLGVTLATSFTLCRAEAQGKMKKDSKAGSGRMMRNDDAMMNDHDGMMDDDDMQTHPAAMGYPNAAPGSVDLYHWSDYTHRHIRTGSALDAKMDKMSMADRRKMANTMDEDEMDTVPLNMNYPRAAPASLDLFHWSDYTRSHVHTGSAMDMKMDKMDMKDKKMHSGAMMGGTGKMMGRTDSMDMYEDDTNTLPVSMNYPEASPGSLDLFHWSDFTHTHVNTGSAMDMKMDKMDKKDKKTRSGKMNK